MFLRRRSFLILVIAALLVSTTVRAQEAPTTEPPIPTAIPTETATLPSPPTEVPTFTPVPTDPPTPEPSFTPLPPPTETETLTPTASLTFTDTPSLEPSASPSLTATNTEEVGITVSPSLTATASQTATTTTTASLTASMTASATVEEMLSAQDVQALNVTCDPSANIQQANVSSTGVEGNVSGNLNSLSWDGRYIYFPSRADTLVTNDTNGMVDYFEFDRTNCQTRRITVGPNGEQGDGDSDVGNISGNGQYFAFASKASNFVAGDTNGKYDIFVKNLGTGVIIRIPADPNNLISTDYYIGDVTISDNGFYVAFDVLVPATTPSGFMGIPVLYNFWTSTRTVIASEGRNVYVSGNGRYIAFVSSASNLVAGDTNNVDDVFIYDINTPSMIRASVMTDGTQSFLAQDYSSISISGNGRFVAFTSLASLAANDTNSLSDVYVRDRANNYTFLVSVQTNGTQFATGAAGAKISADGRYVLFLTDTLTIRDRQNSQTYQISTPYSINGGLDLSANGQYFAFSTQSSTAPNIILNAYVGKRFLFAPPTPTSTYTPMSSASATPTLVFTGTPTATGTFGSGYQTCNPNGLMVSASVNSSGLQGMGTSSNSSISPDGRYIIFTSAADNLVPNDTNLTKDVFRFDSLTCAIIRVSEHPTGAQSNGMSDNGIISINGRYVAFESTATNLVSGDNNNFWDIFVRDLDLNTITRIQYIPDFSMYGNMGFASMSINGQEIAFQSLQGSISRVELYDLSTSQRTLIADNATHPVISGDGRYIVFNTTANIAAGDINNDSDLYIYDRQTQQYERFLINTTSGQPNTSPYGISFSIDGRFITFLSYKSTLVAGDTNGYTDAFVYDRQLQQTTRVSLSSDGTQANDHTNYAQISGNGRFVIFTSKATNLIEDDHDGYSDVFIRDLLTSQTDKISVGFGNTLADGDSDASGSISAYGEYAVFTSYAENLIQNDINGQTDVFVASLSDYQNGYNATSTRSIVLTIGANSAATATAASATQTASAQATPTPTPTVAANTIVVNTAQIIGAGSCTVSSCDLIQAVALSNSTAGVQTITFNIPGTGVHRIILNTSLTITSSVIIDGASQPGYAGSPLIEIVPQAGTGPADAIVVNGETPGSYDPTTSVTIRGLAIGKFLGSAIALNNGQQHVIEDNYIGTIASGTVALGNATGIMMRSRNNIIRNNLISGNDIGLYLYSSTAGRTSTNNTIIGNFIGTNVTGTTSIPNDIGIRLLDGASNNTIGGAGIDEGNVISGNATIGIMLDGLTTSANVIAGNYIGLNASGGSLLANGGTGIQVSGAPNTVIGGATADLGNEIWGNNTGIAVYNQSANTVIQNNVIAQNGLVGINVGDSGTTILENIIAFHTNVGIEIGAGTRNLISRNHIFSNNGLGIDLGGFYSVLPNDPLDADSGANGLQNYPVISAVNNSISGSTITGSLSSKPNSTYRVEFFSNNVCDTSGYGEGQSYIGYTDVTTNASGIANFSAQMPQILENATFGTGWSGVFYPSNNLSGTGVPVSGVNGLNFNWGSGSPVVNGIVVAGIPSDNFSARFTSTQSFAAGTYNFVANSDDGVRVYIDGVLRLDKFTGRPLTSDQFTATLTAGNHTLTVEYFDGMDQAALQFSWYLNGTVSKVITSTATDSSGNTSGFSACRPFQTILGLGSYQETNLAFAYQGNWMSLSGAGNGGSFKYTNAANASMSFWVNSTVSRVTFYRTVHPSYGSTQIFLDGSATPFATINNVSPTVAYGVPFTLALPAGGHRIELRNVGTAYSSIDQIDLLPAAAPLTTTPGVYQDTEPNLTFTGTWVHNPMVGTLGGTRRYTNDPTARVSFKIDSSVGRVVIYRTVYQTGVYGSMQAYVDGVLAATIPNNPSVTFQYGVPYAFEVTPGDHTIELRNVGSTFSDLDQITLLAPATALTLGTVQESADGLTYSGKWTDIADGAALSGARRYTNDPNARVNFKVDSSVGRITIYRTIAGSTFGSLQVYVDGVLNSTITNNTASTVQYGVPFTFAVTPGSHTIELRNVGSKFSDLDQITLAEPAAPLTIGTYQENHADLNYVGNWTTVTNSGLGGGRSYTNDPNARVNFKVDSSVGRVTIYRTIAGSTFGSLQVYVDGVLNTTIANNTSSMVQYGVPFTFAITPGSHTIELRNVGSKFSDLDQIILAEPAARLAVGTYQETQPEITYTGNWISVTNSGLGGGRSYTNDANARATFNIDESVGSITIYRTIAGSTFGTMQVYVDGVLHSTIANNTSSMVQYGVPYTLTLFPGSHTIELRNVGSKFSDLDQIILTEPAALLAAGTYQETDAELTFMGNWTTVTNSGLGGGRSYTNDPNARVSFYVDGTIGRVTIYCTVAGSTFGTMQVYIDGVLHSTIANNISSTVQYGVPYTFAVSLGAHHIELRNVGSKFSDLDQIILEEPLPPLSTTPGTYQESDPTLIYLGNWTTISNSSALGGSRRYTNEVNARVSFPIDAGVGRVIVYRTVAGSTFGSLQIYIDGVLSGTIANNTSTTVQYGVPYTFNVTPGGHWIELRNVGGTFSDIDQIKLIEPAQPLTTAYDLYQDDAFDLSYSGNWQPAYNTQALGGSRTLTNDPNACVSFTIDNSVGRVTIYRSVFSNIYGSLQVYLDGILIGTIMNNTSSTFQYGVPYTFTVIPGNHTIDLRNVGATYSDIDQIVVTAS